MEIPAYRRKKLRDKQRKGLYDEDPPADRPATPGDVRYPARPA